MQQIDPLVNEHLCDAKFYIIGDKAPPEIVALATERIVVAGLQRDVGPFFDSVKLSVAPLRFGAGVKGKINQSMAFGVPVVATSRAVEGMDLTDHEDILVADEPEDFARALMSYTNPKNCGIRSRRIALRKHALRIPPIPQARRWNFCSVTTICEVWGNQWQLGSEKLP